LLTDKNIFNKKKIEISLKKKRQGTGAGWLVANSF
jgi:hypothetical protein